MKKIKSSYAEILFLPHFKDKNKPAMTLENRAAQFAPFSALTGHKEALAETERLTHTKMILAKDAKDCLETKFQILEHYIGTSVEFSFEYFLPDEKKSGGSYRTCKGAVQKIDAIKKEIYIGNQKLYLEQILDIHSEILDQIENEIC